MYDVAVIGGGMAGMATAARLQAQGLTTVVLEAHGLPGGCAGYFKRRGFSFDVGATTLVDFEPGGVGGELLDAIGMPEVPAERLPGYVAWLPDRVVTLHRDPAAWQGERLRGLGATAAHRRLWRLFDELAEVFWAASREGVRLPLASAGDVVRAVRAVGLTKLPLVRYLSWTLGDALRAHGLRDDAPLCGLLSMLIEDTVHGKLDSAPFVNSVLGATIRGAGLTRARGGMGGFWRRFVTRFSALGGHLRVGTAVTAVRRAAGHFVLSTRRGELAARQVVSSLPAALTAELGLPEVAEALGPYLRRDARALGGAVVAFLGVPEAEVSGQAFTHHQLMSSYEAPLGNGNNMFISVSAPEDHESAPAGHRAVMLSTHCELYEWSGLCPTDYEEKKRAAGARLVELARRVYPSLGEQAVIREVATPRTYERFTRRPDGAVGGVRQTLGNSNQHAIPHDLGVEGFLMCGDSTWPGLGTVACVLGSRIVAEKALARAPRLSARDSAPLGMALTSAASAAPHPVGSPRR